jgi:hypothetical protein
MGDKMDEEIDRMRKALEAYEQWEANLITTDKAWTEGEAYPSFTDELWDELLECQRLRNIALRRK